MIQPIATLPNLRDVGGWSTRDGRPVRTGRLYRSVDLSRLDDAGERAFAALGVRTVYDLRTAAERATNPDRLPDTTASVALDVLADARDAAPAKLTAIRDDPRKAAELLGDGRAERLFHAAYREIVALPSARTSYGRFFTGLAERDGGPALVHCTTGKDRTGWAAAALLTLLGVSEADVMRDYLQTNDDLLPALRPLFDRFERAGGDPQLLVPVLGVKAGYLDTAFDELHSRYGSIERYFEDGLGVGPGTQEALRYAFLEG